MKVPKIISDLVHQFQEIRNNLASLYKFLLFIAPFLTIAYYFVFVLEYLPNNLSGKYGGLVTAYFFPPAGKETIIPLMLTSNSLGPSIPAWVVGSTLIIMDVISSFIIAYNWWFAELIIKHVPLINRGYFWLQKKSEKFRKKGWLTMSLVVFMIIPFQGTGGINTSILARLLGVKAKKTVLICFIGSSVTTTLWILWWFEFFNIVQ
jgi:uncharacterized membrane protein